MSTDFLMPAEKYGDDLCSHCGMGEVITVPSGGGDFYAQCITCGSDDDGSTTIAARVIRDLRVAHEVVLKQDSVITARATSEFALRTAGNYSTGTIDKEES